MKKQRLLLNILYFFEDPCQIKENLKHTCITLQHTSNSQFIIYITYINYLENAFKAT